MLVEYYGVEDNFCEWSYIHGVLEHLNLDDNFKIHVVSTTPEWDYREKVVLDKEKKNVIIGLADEWSSDNIPREWKNNTTVFKAYLNKVTFIHSHLAITRSILSFLISQYNQDQ